jgi:hypothetical protein
MSDDSDTKDFSIIELSSTLSGGGLDFPVRSVSKPSGAHGSARCFIRLGFCADAEIVGVVPLFVE